MLCTSLTTTASEFEVDGLSYMIISSEDKTVKVAGLTDSEITELIIPAEVTYSDITYRVIAINDYTFSNSECDNLTSIFIPNSVLDVIEQTTYQTSLPYGSNLKEINVDENNPNYASVDGVLYDKNLKVLIQCPGGKEFVLIPNSVEKIGYYAFYNCSNLESILIPNSVSYIGVNAFGDCNSLKTITFGNGFTESDQNAFRGCKSIEKIYFKTSVPPAKFSASFVDSVYQSATVYVPLGSKSIYEAAGTWKKFANIVEDETVCIDESFTVGDLQYNIISESEKIAMVAKCNNIEAYEISVPFEVVSEGETYSVTTIGGRAFYECKSLNKLELPNSITTISMGAFYDCDRLENIEMPNSVIYIGDQAFESCDALTKVEIPNSVAWIGIRAFAYCENMMTVKIPNSVTHIEQRAFSYCNALESIEFPKNIIVIEDAMVYRCENLKSLVIPRNVIEIAPIALFGCKKLESIYCKAIVPPVFYGFDADVYQQAILSVPIGYKDEYATAEYWRDFLNIVEEEFSGIESVISDDNISVIVNDDNFSIDGVETVDVYSIDGQLVYSGSANNISVAREGVYIVVANGKTFKLAL